MVRYLSLDWIDALNRTTAADDRLTDLATAHELGITQTVTDGPEGEVVYHLQVGDGAVVFGPGPADPEHVSMKQTWQTAVDVATGVLNPQEAFMTGKILLQGDQQRLVQAQPVLGALDSVFQAVRQETDYS